MQTDHLASAEEWLIRAERELIHAEQSFDHAIVINEAIVWHAQQAAEKAVKGFLTAHGRTFPKIHDVSRLVTTAAEIDREFETYSVQAQTLSPYAIEFRYPDGELEPGDAATRESVRMAREIVAFVRERLSAAQESLPPPE